MMDENVGADIIMSANAGSGTSEVVESQVKHIYTVECFDSEGNFKWIDRAENLVPTVGLNDIIDKYYKGSTYTAAHYVGLTGTTPTPAAGDTMSSHAGWTEFTNYTESPNVRQTLTLGTVSSGSASNTASKATFTVGLVSPDTNTIGGAFLSTDSTVGGTAGTLVSVAAFSAGDKVLNSSDTLSVTVTVSATSA